MKRLALVVQLGRVRGLTDLTGACERFVATAIGTVTDPRAMARTTCRP